jgi:hypothetical protein
MNIVMALACGIYGKDKRFTILGVEFRVKERTLVNVRVDEMALFGWNLKHSVGSPGLH